MQLTFVGLGGRLTGEDFLTKQVMVLTVAIRRQPARSYPMAGIIDLGLFGCKPGVKIVFAGGGETKKSGRRASQSFRLSFANTATVVRTICICQKIRKGALSVNRFSKSGRKRFSRTGPEAQAAMPRR